MNPKKDRSVRKNQAIPKIGPEKKDRDSDVDAITENTDISIDDSRDDETGLNVRYFNGKKVCKPKDAALEYLQSHPNEGLHLFSQDIGKKSGPKEFIVADYDTIYRMSVGRDRNFYENYGHGDKIRLFLDVDYPLEGIDTKAAKLVLNRLLIDTRSLVEMRLIGRSVINPRLIVLDASTSSKVSMHLIYPDVYFDEINEMGLFLEGLDDELKARKCVDFDRDGIRKVIDPSVYRVGCLRMLWCSKKGKNNRLEFLCGYNGYIKGSDRELFDDCLLLNVQSGGILVRCEKQQMVPEKPASKCKKGTGSKKDPVKRLLKGINRTIPRPAGLAVVPLDVLQKLVDLLNKRHACNRNKWIMVGMALKNSNLDAFEIWREWSSYCKTSYDETVCRYTWDSFVYRGRPVTVASLHYQAKLDSPVKYMEEFKKSYQDDKPVDAKYIEFSKPYMLSRLDEKIGERADIVTQTLDDWMTGTIESKVLCVRSPYDTAKTTLVKTLIEEYGPERVLFVTYRETLTNDLYGNFSGLGFESYKDGNYRANRMICQIESLKYLMEESDDGVYKMPSYDLVVFDEIESDLMHVGNRGTIKEIDRVSTFGCMTDLLDGVRKCLLLDGDLGNRALTFVRDYDPVVLVNTYKKGNKNFKFVDEKSTIDNAIDADLKAGKNVVIVSMVSELATSYYVKYKDTYKAVLHTSLTDDTLKEELKDVNRFWSRFQLVVYSPSIECGVNFNPDMVYFDRIYGIISAHSTTPRGFLQMVARVRKVRSNDIMVYTNKVTYMQYSVFWNFDDIKEFMNGYLDRYRQDVVVIGEDGSKKGVIKDMRNDVFEDVMVYNEVEELNSKPYNFVAWLIKLLSEKGNRFQYDGDESRDAVKKDAVYSTKEEILKAFDFTDAEATDAAIRQRGNRATTDDKLGLRKYAIRKLWGLGRLQRSFWISFIKWIMFW